MQNITTEKTSKGIAVILDEEDDGTYTLKYGDAVLFNGADLTVNNREFETLYHKALADEIEQADSPPEPDRKRKAKA